MKLIEDKISLKQKMKQFLINAEVTGSKEYWKMWKWSLAFIASGMGIYFLGVLRNNFTQTQFRQNLLAIFICIGFVLIPVISKEQKDRIVKDSWKVLVYLFGIMSCVAYFTQNKEFWFMDLLFSIILLRIVLFTFKILHLLFRAFLKLIETVNKSIFIKNSEIKSSLVLFLEKSTAILVSIIAFFASVYGVINILKQISDSILKLFVK